MGETAGDEGDPERKSNAQQNEIGEAQRSLGHACAGKGDDAGELPKKRGKTFYSLPPGIPHELFAGDELDGVVEVDVRIVGSDSTRGEILDLEGVNERVNGHESQTRHPPARSRGRFSCAQGQ